MNRGSRQEGHSAPEPGCFTAENTEITGFGVSLDEELSFTLTPPRLGGEFASGGIHEAEPFVDFIPS
jgi:hypothetical protein